MLVIVCNNGLRIIRAVKLLFKAFCVQGLAEILFSNFGIYERKTVWLIVSAALSGCNSRCHFDMKGRKLLLTACKCIRRQVVLMTMYNLTVSRVHTELGTIKYITPRNYRYEQEWKLLHRNLS